MAITVGVDLSASPDNTAVVRIDWAAALPRITVVHECRAHDDDVLAAIEHADRAGVDAPLGWPVSFVDAVRAHREERPWPLDPRGDQGDELRLRATDRRTRAQFQGANAELPRDDPRRVRVPTLSVSSDRIAGVAMRWAHLATQWNASHPQERVDRTGGGRVVEVYPAAAMHRWEVLREGYKARRAGRAHRQMRRREICQLLDDGGCLHLDDMRAACASSDHVLDALAAALVARAAMSPDLVEPVPEEHVNLAAVEGWIRLPVHGSLSRLRCLG